MTFHQTTMQHSLEQATRDVAMSNGIPTQNAAETTWKVPRLTDELKNMNQPFVAQFNQWIQGVSQLIQTKRNAFYEELASLKRLCFLATPDTE